MYTNETYIWKQIAAFLFWSLRTQKNSTLYYGVLFEFGDTSQTNCETNHNNLQAASNL